jgi:hypothetical protein
MAQLCQKILKKLLHWRVSNFLTLDLFIKKFNLRQIQKTSTKIYRNNEPQTNK